MYNVKNGKIIKEMHWLDNLLLFTLIVGFFIYFLYMPLPKGVHQLAKMEGELFKAKDYFIEETGQDSYFIVTVSSGIVNDNRSLLRSFIYLANPKIYYTLEPYKETTEQETAYSFLMTRRSENTLSALAGENYNVLPTVAFVNKDNEGNFEIGDIVLEIDGAKITSVDVLNKDEEIHSITIIRENKEVTVDTNSLPIIRDITYAEKLIVDFNAFNGDSAGLMTILQLEHSDLINGRKITGTGTIELDKSVGEIGGVQYKVRAAARENMDIFFIPAGGDNEKEALEVIETINTNMQVVPVSTLDDAVTYLRKGGN